MKHQTIGIIGVGLMGHGIAKNIQKNGWQINFLDHPGNQPVEDLLENGATPYLSCAELASASDIIILCVTGSPQVEAVLMAEDGVLAGIKPGATVIDCSTAIPTSTRQLAEKVAAAGARLMDAPMTRTPKEAAEGRLNLIVGGNKALFNEHLPLLSAFAENITYAGEVGSGHTLKLLHNFVSLGFSAILSEAVACSNRAGIDPEILHTVLAKGGGAGVILDRFTPFILEGDASSFTFSLANSAKDLGYYTSMCSDLAASQQLADAVSDLFDSQVDTGNAAKFVPQLIELLDGK